MDTLLNIKNKGVKITVTPSNIIITEREISYKKEDFLKFELEFEDIEKLFTIKDENDFVDFFISDIHKDKIMLCLI